MSRNNKGKIVTIRRFYDINAAEFAVSVLAGEGIKAALVGANMFNAMFFYGWAMGGIRLEVCQEDAEAANEILDDNLNYSLPPDGSPQEEQPDIESEEVENAQKCPRCGSADLIEEKYERKSFFLTILLLGFPIPLKKKKTECLTCGYIY